MAAGVPLSIQTIHAELVDRCTIAAFERDFPLDGNFVVSVRGGRRYWYFQFTQGGAQTRRYVGPEAPELLARIQRHRGVRSEWRERREMVQALKRARMPAPDHATGEVLAALADAGVFRVRAAVVGTVAYQTYGPMLGVRFAAQALRTEDVDIAQFRTVSLAVEDATPPLIDVLRRADPTFRPVPAATDAGGVTSYVSGRGLRVEVLTPNTGPDSEAPRSLPALGTDARPLRFLDFLIYDAVPTAALHGAGVLINVPAPERFALHKLILARRRRAESSKIAKDLRQAQELLDVLAAARPFELRDAWRELQGRGPAWRRLAEEGLAMIDPEVRRRAAERFGSGDPPAGT